MADISKLSRLISGVQRNVDLSTNTIVVGSIKIGATELTKAILDKLILINSAADADGTFDTRYHTQAVLAGTTGSSLVGSPTGTVESRLLAVEAAAGSGTAADISFDPASTSFSANDLQELGEEIDDRIIATETVANAAIPAAQKGAVNGVATLDANQVIPIAQIPAAALERLVIVADETARFALTTTTVQNGDSVKQADTEVMYFVKDDTNLDSELGYSVYSAGTAAAVEWSGVLNTPTTVAGYGITDVDDVAKAAAVADAIVDGVTDVAPSQNAVFDALALKQNASAELTEAVAFFAATDISGAEAEQLTNASNADSLHSHAVVKRSMVAGEIFAATLFAVRPAKAADAGFVAGRVYKADIDASSVDNFHVTGLVNSAASVAGAIVVTKMGPMTVTAHGFTVGQPLYLSASGAITETAPSATNTAVVKIGMAEDANTIDVQIQIMGVN